MGRADADSEVPKPLPSGSLSKSQCTLRGSPSGSDLTASPPASLPFPCCSFSSVWAAQPHFCPQGELPPRPSPAFLLCIFGNSLSKRHTGSSHFTELPLQTFPSCSHCLRSRTRFSSPSHFCTRLKRKPKSTEQRRQRGGSGCVKPVASLSAGKATTGALLGLGLTGSFQAQLSSAKEDAEQCCCLLSAPKAAVLCCCSSLLGSLLAPTRHAIYFMAEISSLGEGHILSQQGMFSSLYVFPSPIASILSSSHARNCDHGKPWKHKQTESNPSRAGQAVLDEMHQSLDNVLSNVLSKQHLLLEPSHPRSRCLSSSSCAFSHL